MIATPDSAPLHHPREVAAYERAIAMWAEAVAREEDPRCASCWLRQRQCYCAVFRNRRAALAARFNTAHSEASAEELESGVRLRHCEVLLYYHHDELGRSCNTGRVLEALSPLSCRSLLHGDQDKERRLLAELRAEQDEGLPRTCILYPHPDAPTLTEWIRSRPAACRDLPVRIVALDGTYPQASRQMKFLRRCLDGKPLGGLSESDGGGATDGPRGAYNLPLVRLDINADTPIIDADVAAAPEGNKGRRGVTSALAGICNQPAGEKICTLQAVIMALQCCGESAALCDALTAELNDWIAYILKERIRMGKVKLKVIRDLSSFEPIPAVSQFMSSQTRSVVDRQVSRESTRQTRLAEVARADAATTADTDRGGGRRQAGASSGRSPVLTVPSVQMP